MNPILYWHDVALETNKVTHSTGGEQRGPVLSARALAMAHLAMHDAHFGIAGGQTVYTPGLIAPAPGASQAAAIAAAAHFVLKALYPSQQPYLDGRLAAAPTDAGDAANGAAYGIDIGAKLTLLRAGDPHVGDAGHVASKHPRHHRVDPDNPGQGFYAPYYGGSAKGFAIQTLFDLNAPPAEGSVEYNEAVDEVRRLGIKPELTGTLPAGDVRRTGEQTLIGLFWGYDGAKNLGTPPRLYNQIVRKIAVSRGATTADLARLFALVNAAMADAGMLAWKEKYTHDFWRPVVGLREHDGSMGPMAQQDDDFDPHCDPFWLPMGAPKSNETGVKNFTPNFPAYPSGHATFGAAAFQMARRFYGVNVKGPDDLCKNLRFTSEELNGVTTDNNGTVRPNHERTFKDGLWQAIEENGRSRVYLGVHWVFDAFMASDAGKYDMNVGGVPLGLNIANNIFDSGLKPSPPL